MIRARSAPGLDHTNLYSGHMVYTLILVRIAGYLLRDAQRAIIIA
jgi:hypothetical protein